MPRRELRTPACCSRLEVVAVRGQFRRAPARARLRRKGGEQAYALIEHGEAEYTEAAARETLRNFPDPERRQGVEADGELLIQQWSGRSRRMRSLADFLASGKTARIISWDATTAYLFARRDEDTVTLWTDLRACATRSASRG